MTSLTSSGDYLRSDLGSFLWVYHADVFKVFESVLSVFLLSTNILLQHVEYVTRLQEKKKKNKIHQFRMTRFYFFHWRCIPSQKPLVLFSEGNFYYYKEHTLK